MALNPRHVTSDARGGGHLRIFVSVIIGFLLTVIPLPEVVKPYRPDWIVLLMIYWSLSSPRIAGLAFAWFCGFLIDLLRGAVLGQHALAFLVVGFITHRIQLRMRIFTVWHQAFTVLMLLGVYQFIIFWIDGMVGKGLTGWERWFAVGTGALMWPPLVAIMDTVNRRRR
jgi:rod shape-determining protein MreD